MPASEVKRPRGVVVIAIWFVISALYLAVLNVSRVVDGSVSEPRIVELTIAVAWAVSAYGVWALRSWGWWLGWVMPFLPVLVDVVNAIGGGGLIYPLIDLVIALVVLRYLRRPGVRGLFQGPRHEAHPGLQ